MSKNDNKSTRVIEINEDTCSRGVKKESELQAVSVLRAVDPEVAKTVVSQTPHVVNGLVSVEHDYFNLLSQSLKSCDESYSECKQVYFKKIDLCVNEAQKDIPFDQKQYFIGEIDKAIPQVEIFEEEHRSSIESYSSSAAWNLIGVGLLVGGLCLGGVLIRSSSRK